MVEGPLAGGHLGFGMDWANYDLREICREIHQHLQSEKLDIPIIAAGGIFTGSDAVSYLETGIAAVQVATRFTVTHECGLPEPVAQEYFKSSEEDIEVNMISPTGYPMRMLKKSPAIGAGVRPNCEAYGYLLDGNGGAPTSPPTMLRWRPTQTQRRSRSRTRPACAPRCVTLTAGPADTTPIASRTPRIGCPMGPTVCSRPSMCSGTISSVLITRLRCQDSRSLSCDALRGGDYFLISTSARVALSRWAKKLFMAAPMMVFNLQRGNNRHVCFFGSKQSSTYRFSSVARTTDPIGISRGSFASRSPRFFRAHCV